MGSNYPKIDWIDQLTRREHVATISTLYLSLQMVSLIQYFVLLAFQSHFKARK